MEVCLLGPLEVRHEGHVVAVAGRRLRLLVAVLALRAGQVVEAEGLIDLLWEETSLPADPVNALQALASRLRRALEPASASELLVSKPPGYLLAVEPDQVDALRFERLAAVGHSALLAGRQREAAAALREGLGLWRGPALADFAGEPFAAANATRLNELRLGALEDRIEADLGLGEHDRLVGELEALVSEHPLRERPHALLMRALYAAGRQAEALAAYQRAREILAERAGLDPGPELRKLQEAILAQDPSLRPPPPAAEAPPAEAPAPAASPPVAEPPPRRGHTNLRAPLTSFVGRDREIIEVLRLLHRNRLVTLTGPGGVGKTRLALEAARRLRVGGRPKAGRLAPDGLWLVEVAGLRDGSLLPLALLDALGLNESRPRLDAPPDPAGTEERLLRALEPRRALLLLDNCEHLVEPVAKLVERLLIACPELRVLATSREPLRVPGEARWQVPALPVPPPGPASSEDLADFAGTRLFLERAAAADPGFAVSAEAAGAVAEICRRLDGLPLAIELAAARVGALPPATLAARLDSRFRLLTAGARTALPRQQTLRAVVDWSWDLLDRSERAVLRRLAVFASGCTLAAAEAVCAGPDLPAAEVAETISRLVDKSLVTAGTVVALPPLWWPGIEALGLPPPEPAGEEPRYSLLETVRTYAAERLEEAGEADRVARAHAEWCLRLAEAAEPGLRGRDQLVWIGRLSVDLDNLRAALQWLLDHGEAAPAVRLSAALSGFLLQTGHREEAARWLAAALDLPGPVPDQARGQAILALGWTDAAQSGRPGGSRWTVDDAQAALERAATSDTELTMARVMVAAVRLFQDPGGEAARVIDSSIGEVERIGGWPAAVIHLVRGISRARRGDLAGLGEDAEVCLARFRELGDRWGSVQSLEMLATLDMMHGRYRQATERLQEALRHAWEMRMKPEVGVQLCRLAHVAVLQGDLRLAEFRLGQALAAAEELGLGLELAFARAGLSVVALRRGDIGRARLERQRALALLQRHHRAHPLGYVLLTWLAILAEGDGDLEGAEAMHRGVFELARVHSSPGLVAQGLEGLAGTACARGDAERAAVLLGAAAAIRRGVGAPLSLGVGVDRDRIAAAARQALGDERFTRAHARGEGLPLKEAVALAERP